MATRAPDAARATTAIPLCVMAGSPRVGIRGPRPRRDPTSLARGRAARQRRRAVRPIPHAPRGRRARGRAICNGAHFAGHGGTTRFIRPSIVPMPLQDGGAPWRGPGTEATMAHYNGALEELEDLDRRNWSAWLINGLLLIVMAAVITSLYLPQVWGLIVPEIPAPETRGMLVMGLCGLVLIFMLYMLLKQRQTVQMRDDLIRGRMREEILRSRLSEITSLFDMS